MPPYSSKQPQLPFPGFFLAIRNGLMLLFLFGIHSQSQASETNRPNPIVTILYSAESHGALLPCDCPLEPWGGVSRRAALIKSFREKGPVILVDAGGWAAGGIYDELSFGDTRQDILRTTLMAQSMKLMQYDAICLGDEERPYWQIKDESLRKLLQTLPMVSANTASKQIRNSGILVEKESVKIWVGGLTTTESFGATIPESSPMTIQDPLSENTLSTLKNGWKKPTAKPTIRIILGHIGEKKSHQLIDKLNGIHLIINAHRKTNPTQQTKIKETTMVQFDYQSRSLGVIEVFRGNNGSPWRFQSKFVPLNSSVPNHPEIQNLITPHEKALQTKKSDKLRVEYWTMSYCPGCSRLHPELKHLSKLFKDKVEIVPRFLIHKNADGSFASLHGETELQENKIQALVWKYWPDKFWDYTAWRSENPSAPWQEGAEKLKLLRARLRGALAIGEADEILKNDYDISKRRNIEGTPTLVLGNKIYNGPPTQIRIASAVCALLNDPKPEYCKTVPDCFFDTQCKRRGHVGKCLDAGTPKARCDYTKAVPVKAWILYEPNALQSNHEKIADILIGDLPGLEPQLISIHSPEGKQLIKEMTPERLPAYFLDPVAKKEKGFVQNLGNVTRAKSGKLVLHTAPTGANRIAERKRIPGRLDLFVSRFSKNGQEALEEAISAWDALPDNNRPQLVIHDILFISSVGTPDGETKEELAAPRGLAEVEEAARAAAIKMLAPDKLIPYLLERGKLRGSSYWDKPMKTVGLDPEKIRALAEGPDKKIRAFLRQEAEFLKAINAGGKIVVLGENCEILTTQSRHDLKRWIKQIGARNINK